MAMWLETFCSVALKYMVAGTFLTVLHLQDTVAGQRLQKVLIMEGDAWLKHSESISEDGSAFKKKCDGGWLGN